MDGNKFVVAMDGKNGETLFLVDRSKTKEYWWSLKLDKALIYNSKYPAKKRANTLLYGNVYVLTLDQALSEEMDNSAVDVCDEHPFSEDAFRG